MQIVAARALGTSPPFYARARNINREYMINCDWFLGWQGEHSDVIVRWEHLESYEKRVMFNLGNSGFGFLWATTSLPTTISTIHTGCIDWDWIKVTRVQGAQDNRYSRSLLPENLDSTQLIISQGKAIVRASGISKRRVSRSSWQHIT